MTEKAWFAMLLFTGVVFSNCNQNTVFEKSIPLEGSWDYTNQLDFGFTIKDTSNIYSLWLDIDHSNTFPYQNLYVQIHTSFPDGNKKSDIVSLELANKNGLWNGRCRGETCQVNIPLQEKTYFQMTGDYRIRLEQYMRQDNLPGLKTFNLRLLKEPS